MASKVAQKNWKGSYASVEGVTSIVPYKGSVLKVLREIMSNVRSGMSYTGARNLKELVDKAEFVLQTSSSIIESGPHIYANGGKS
jgi:IMP dehydrogenase